MWQPWKILPSVYSSISAYITQPAYDIKISLLVNTAMDVIHFDSTVTLWNRILYLVPFRSNAVMILVSPTNLVLRGIFWVITHKIRLLELIFQWENVRKVFLNCLVLS